MDSSLSGEDLQLQDAWALAGEWLWDGNSDICQQELCVVIQGDRIQGVCSCEEARRFGMAVKVHHGCCLLPGLIDAHVHMEFDETYPLHQQPELPREKLVATMEQRANRMVRSGITTARDLGGRNFVSLELRDAISARKIIGPRLLCAGQPITVPGGHCHQWGGVAATLTEARAVVERQVSENTDWIKVMATGGMRTPGTDITKAQFQHSDLEEIVKHSNACGRYVAAHAHGTAGVAAAVAAGCRTVEHCTWIGDGGLWGCLDEAVVQQMVTRGTFVSPTAHANWRYRPMGDRNYKRMCSALQQLRQAGVPLIASSDAGAIPRLSHNALAGGVEVLAAMADLTPIEALRSATSTCAEALGLGTVCGRIAAGLAADLLLVDGNPTTDLSALRRPRMIVACGRCIEPEAPPPPPRWN